MKTTCWIGLVLWTTGCSGPHEKDRVEQEITRSTTSVVVTDFDGETAQAAAIGQSEELRQMRLWLQMASDAFDRGEFDLAEVNARQAIALDSNNAQAKELIRLATDSNYRADQLGMRRNFNKEWRAIMERLEYDAMPHPELLNYPPQGFWDRITRIRAVRGPAGEDSTPGRPQSWRRSSVAPHTSRLQVGPATFLPLEATHLAVRVDGFRARVVVDLFYRNDQKQQLNGNLQLRLPSGARPDYTAFGSTQRAEFADVPGTTLSSMRVQRPGLREARMVPREKAAHAYTETVRRRVDPALVEWSGAGVYDVQVFPLEPGRLHQISIAYTTDLVPTGNQLALRLALPEGNVEVDLRTSDGEHRRLRNPPDRILETRIQNPGVFRMNGSDPDIGALYACRFKPDLPQEPGAVAKAGTFLVDTSHSSKLEEWLDLLEEILTRNRESMQSFRVGFFDMGLRWWRPDATANTAENVRAVLDHARTLSLGGATDLDSALAAASRIEGRADLFLLSDGAATWGETDMHALRAHIRKDQTLFAYTTGGQGADLRTLTHLARETGGAVFTISDTASFVHAATAHTHRPWQIVGIDAPGTDVLLRGRPTSVYAGQAIVLTGRGRLRSDTPIALRLRQGDRTRTVTVAAARPIQSALVPTVYGEVAVQQLEEFAPVTERDARAYALHFRVVGQNCSLLMLESEEDYARFSIEPAQEAAYVREHPASRAVSSARSTREQPGTDPKTRLRAFLQKLERGSGFEFRRNDAITALLDGATPTDLEIPVANSTALREAGSRLEEAPGDTALAHLLAYAALEQGNGSAAYHLFRRCAAIRPHEAHHFFAMALALEATDRTTLCKLWYEVALAGAWHSRFGELRRIVRTHYSAYLRRVGDPRAQVIGTAAQPASADSVVTILWNTDRTDIDLRIKDAADEVCAYDHVRTRMGGHLSRDVTAGYGPEMFILPLADPGDYEARAHNYATDSRRVGTRTAVCAIVVEGWGRPNERRRFITLLIEPGSGATPIAKWSVAPER